MIGYYVHHHGRGHLHRALSVARELDGCLVGLSTLERPAEWTGAWIDLPDDADGAEAVDPTAGGTLHWVPERHRGLRERMGEISRWIIDVEPDLLVVDVSVEVALLARLHGVPVVVVAQPGDRRDAPHTLGYGIADRVVAAWPTDARGMLTSDVVDEHQLMHVGAFSRFDDRPVTASGSDGGRHVVVLHGAGGTELSGAQLESAKQRAPGWTWTVLGEGGVWVDDPWDELCRADVVITHAGQNALAEVAAARRPAVVVPQSRPFDEQRAMSAALDQRPDLPVVVRGGLPGDDLEAVLEKASHLDGGAWAAWNDGRGAARLVAVLRDLETGRRG